MTDVAAWLRGLGLGQYEAAFRDNAVDDANVLRELTEADLEKLGVRLGDRKRILKAAAALGAAEAWPPAEAAAERRHLTVLFCDLAGSTALSGRLDPEDLREVMAAYHSAVAEVIERHGGYVAKLLGDGVLAYFGWPEAHEDDAERAMRAGLAACAAVAGLGTVAGPLAARAGIATGPVVVGEVLGRGEARERGVVGETPNLAARLQAMADQGAVVADAATRRLTGTLFAWADLGGPELKGLPGPVRAWRALGGSGVESRFEALRAAATHLPLVGRGEELELLLRRWRRARADQGEVVLLRGEAGIGKSRLTAALQEEVAGKDREELVLYCSPQHTDSALRPVIARLERGAGMALDDAPDTRLSKLEALLTPLAPPPEDVALIAELLSVPTLGRWPEPDLAPQRRRERLLQALLRRVRGLAACRPVLAVVEDAHWVDPTTRDLLDLLVAEAPSMALLLVVTHRPEFGAAAWLGPPHVTPLHLDRLAPAEHAALLRQVANGKALPPEVEAEVLARTDGVPLFVEEVGRAVLEGGLLREEADRWVLDGRLPRLAVPASLQASLTARLGRLSSVREVAQAGAVLGREFAHGLVAEVSGLPAARLREALGRLEGAGLLHRRGEPPDAAYVFKHALVQDAAYGTLLRSRRRELHARAAAAIARLRPGVAEREPEVLARHLAEGGDPAGAADCYLKAAALALERSAMAEAVAQLTRGIEAATALPADSDERRTRELDLQVALGGALVAAKGHAAPETGRAFARARELCRGPGDARRRVRVLFGLAVYHVNRAEAEEGLAAAEEAMALAPRQDGATELIANRAMAIALWHIGRMAPARGHLERMLALFDPARDRGASAAAYSIDARVMALTFLAKAFLCLGHPEQARARACEAIAEARALGHAHSLAQALATAGCRVDCFARDDDGLAARAGEVVALCDERGFPFYGTTGLVYLGWALVGAGRAGEGIRRMEEGLGVYRATGAETFVPHFLGLLAHAHGRAGEPGRGLGLLDEALARVERSGERWFEAELYRIRGELLRALPRSPDRAAEAEASLARAVTCARREGVRWWELRAARDLARLRRDQGRVADARGLLALVYAAFTEGFAFPDLVEAKALLEELGVAPADSADRRKEEVRMPSGPDRLRDPVPGR